MSENGFAEQINREISKQNSGISNKIDEIMQSVMNDPDIHDRSDWDQIQKTLSLIIASLDTDEMGEAIEDLSSISQMPEIEALINQIMPQPIDEPAT